MLASLHTQASVLLSIRMTESVSSGIFIDGVEMSPAPPDLVVEYHGQVLVSGTDHFARLKADGENYWVVESLLRDGRTTRRIRDNGWTTGADVPRLPDALRTMESLDPLGTVERDGKTLTRFAGRTAEPVQLATIWYTDTPSAKPDKGTIEILATPDGTPVAAIVEISSDDMSIAMPDLPAEPRTYRAEITWDEVPSGMKFPDPSEKLVSVAIPNHDLTIGLPADWKLETIDGLWAWYQSPGPDAYLGVARVDLPATAIGDPPEALLAGWSKAVIKQANEELGVEPDAVEALLAGGIRGRLATYRVPGDAASTQMYAMFVSGTWAYVVRWQSDDAFELVWRYRFERIVESIKLSAG